ncbi:D-erythrulose reductase-like [Macrobrachium nipponense]|uniref:D-erythrulose reductase-like n=1 Tax=Macrobrachium nipponense TaxID=159736 RepID=UPI0030C8BB03
MGKFTGKRALVTGAGAGIGRALAIKLVEMGAEVFALSKTAANLESLKAECPALTTVCVDLSDWTATRETVKKLTPIHLLINNAAAAVLDPFLTATPESFDKLFNINVKAMMNVSQVVAGDLIVREQRGSIVNVSSQAGQRALRDHTVYCSTKGAVDMMTKVMALELAPKGVRVNAVSPTVVMTDMGRIGWSDPAKAGPMLARIPQGRFAEVDDVVNAIIYLLSDESDMVNGHLLPVDGGFLAA